MTGEVKVTTRTFTVKEGMTLQEVVNSPKATAMQKKMAAVFDSDGNKVFSKREAAVFNATAISDHGKEGVSLWTKYADGTRKETVLKGDLKALKYAPQGTIKAVKYPSGKPQTKTVKSESKTVYKAPKIGEFGIQAADTLYALNTNNIAEIRYYSDKAKKNMERYDEFDAKTGKIRRYTYLLDDKTNHFRDYITYNPDGSRRYDGYHADGKFYETGYHDNGRRSWVTESDIKTGKELKATYYLDDGYSVSSIYTSNKDGSTTIERTDRGKYGEKTGKTVTLEDKNENTISEKHFDSNDILQYTVIPKRNSEGDVIKNDTIWNRQK
ncbi:hypothetical protein IKQ21_01375 [bacterium]|nr:hypothetical protein [bacterium]